MAFCLLQNSLLLKILETKLTLNSVYNIHAVTHHEPFCHFFKQPSGCCPLTQRQPPKCQRTSQLLPSDSGLEPLLTSLTFASLAITP
jgi:hypothetical protein